MQDELKKSIEELREEAGKLSDDAESQERLNRIIGVLENQVGDTDEDDGVMENIGEFIDDSIVHFETSHPAVTAAINRAAGILSNLGI